jgi:excinuclease ABC subunit C
MSGERSGGGAGGGGATRRAALLRKVDALPREPGIYLFRDSAGTVLYVGKAKTLRDRVRGYFQPGGDGRLFVRFIERRVADVEVVVTRSEKEALLLENNVIKTHQPRYNVRLKDDKSFLQLRIDAKHPFPAIVPVRRPRKDGARYLGPYASARAIRTTLRMVRSVFPLRDCRDAEFDNRTRPCLKHQIGMCAAPCVGLVTKEQYGELLEGAVRVLQGDTAELLARLQEGMRDAAAKLEYERAAVLRDRIAFLSTSTEAQAVEGRQFADRDAFGLHRRGRRIELCLLEFRGGKLLTSRPFSLATDLPDDEALSSFLGAWYAGARPLPDEVLLPLPAYAMEAFAELWSERRGRPVRVAVPRAGSGLRALEMANRNAELAAQTAHEQQRIERTVLEDVRRRLGLAHAPRRIECIDVSHTQGAAPVASLVVFTDGRPDKAAYRRFRVRTTAGNDDFGAMREVVARRFRPGRGAPPDLLLLDGGRPQLAAVEAVLAERGVAVELAAIVKAERRGRGLALSAEEVDHVVRPGVAAPIALPPDDEACFLLQRVRDEAHRFAIAYHRRLRSRGALESELVAVAGLGAKRIRALLAGLGGLRGLKAASREQIAAVPGIGVALAERVWRQLHLRPDAD